MHELRGWKGATIHDPSSEPDKVAALEDLTRSLDLDAIRLGLGGRATRAKRVLRGEMACVEQ